MLKITPLSRPLRVSKYLRHQVLLSQGEMEHLFQSLGSFYLMNISEPLALENAEISKEAFLEAYKTYEKSHQEEGFEKKEHRSLFSSALSLEKDIFEALALKDGRFLIKPQKPVIQIQAHSFFVSNLDGSFHPMVFGKDSIKWGLQFSYPQLFQDPHTHQIEKVRSEGFVNTPLFLKLCGWLRDNTLPTRFEYQGKKITIPIRLGKQLSWIDRHYQLQAKGISVSRG